MLWDNEAHTFSTLTASDFNCEICCSKFFTWADKSDVSFFKVCKHKKHFQISPNLVQLQIWDDKPKIAWTDGEFYPKTVSLSTSWWMEGIVLMLIENYILYTYQIQRVLFHCAELTWRSFHYIRNATSIDFMHNKNTKSSIPLLWFLNHVQWFLLLFLPDVLSKLDVTLLSLQHHRSERWLDQEA